MVSSETGKIGIITEAKKVNTAMAIRYKDAREAIKAFLTDPKRDRSVIDAAIGRFEQAENDPSLSTFLRSDAACSREALEAFEGLKNQIGGFEYFPAPPSQPKLLLSGITISITLDALIKREHKGAAQIGGVLFRFTQADGESEAAVSKRRDMAAYAATLVHMQVSEAFSGNRTPHHAICFAMDVQCREAVPAPKSYSQRAKNMENACKFISAIWDDI